jgi:hypothetical protein
MVSKDNVLEELRIQHALAAAGYYAYRINKHLGSGEIEICARAYTPGHDEQLMAGCAEQAGILLKDA